MPIILATEEAEIRRIMVQNQPRHGSGDPISKKPIITKKKKKGWWSGSR
jgi:hypothetical protein